MISDMTTSPQPPTYRKGSPRIFIIHAHSWSSHQATNINIQHVHMHKWWVMECQCAGKKSGEESLWSLPSPTLTLVILSSHQCNCSSLRPVILKTLETTFRSIRDITISISSSPFNFLFLMQFWPRRRSFTFDVFCTLNSTRVRVMLHKQNMWICTYFLWIYLFRKMLLSPNSHN